MKFMRISCQLYRFVEYEHLDRLGQTNLQPPSSSILRSVEHHLVGEDIRLRPAAQIQFRPRGQEIETSLRQVSPAFAGQHVL